MNARETAKLYAEQYGWDYAQMMEHVNRFIDDNELLLFDVVCSYVDNNCLNDVFDDYLCEAEQ